MHSGQLMSFAMILGLCLTPAVHAEDAPACVLTRLVNIPMKLDRSGRPIIAVTVNGVQKLALIDTGGGFSSMTEMAAKKLTLQTVFYPRHNIYFINGKSPSEMAPVKRFVAGELNLAHATDGLYFAIDETSQDSSEYDFTLSPDILHLFDVELDYGARTFQLFLRTTCGENVVHWTNKEPAVVSFETNNVDWQSDSQQMVGVGIHFNDPTNQGLSANSRTTNVLVKIPEWHMTTHGKLDGVDVNVIIDTGSSTSSMIADEAKQVMRERTNGSQDDPARAFKTLRIGSLTINNPQIVIENTKLARIDTINRVLPQVRLGATVLRNLHLYIAYKDKKIYLTDAETK